MSIEAYIEVDEALRYFDRVLDSTKNLAPVLKTIGADWEGRAKLTFIEQRDPWGNQWAPLKDSTLRLRKKRGNSGAEILRDSGEMARSVDAEVAGNTLALSIDSPAAIHQEGNPENTMWGAPAPIPQRPIFPVRDGKVDLPDSWSLGIFDIIEHLLEPR